MEASILISKFFLIIFIFFFFFNGNQNQKYILGKAKIIDGDTIHIGNDKIKQIIIVKNDPIKDPPMPANSGSLESPLEKK